MYFFTRFRVANFGTPTATFKDETFDFRDKVTGEPTDVLIHAENGTGKTTLLGAFYSVIEPNQRRFLPAMANAARSLKDYLDDRGVPALMAKELYNAEEELVPVKFVIGQFAALKSDGDDSAPNRVYFSFRDNGQFTFDSLPQTTPHNELKNWDDVQSWLKRAAQELPKGAFFHTVSQTAWYEHLLENNVDADVYSHMPEFSKSEGGIDQALLTWKNEREFLARVFDFAMPSQRSEDTRLLIETNIKRLRDLPRLYANVAALNKLDTVFETFRSHAGRHAGAVADEARARLALDEGIAALIAVTNDLAGQQVSQKETLTGLNVKLEETQRQIEQTSREAEAAEAAALTLELAAAQAEETGHVQALKTIERTERAVKAARELAQSRAAQLLIEGLDAQIRAADSGLDEFRVNAQVAGSRYAIALGRESERLAGDLKALDAEVTTLKAELLAAQAQEAALRRASQEGAAGQTRLEVKIESIAEAGRDLAERGILSVNESAADALLRLDARANAAAQEVAQCQLDAQALEVKRTAAQQGVAAGAEQVKHLASQVLVQERALITRQEQVEAIKRLPILARFSGGETLDFSDGSLLERIEEHLTRQAEEREAAQGQARRLSAQIESIERTGLAGANPDVETVLGELKRAGVKSAISHLEYLARVERDAGRAQRLFSSDPARYAGIALVDPAEIDRARAVIGLDLGLASPVMVSVATRDEGPGAGAQGFIVPATSAAAFNQEAAAQELERLKAAKSAMEAVAADHAAVIRDLKSLAALVTSLRTQLAGQTLAGLAQGLQELRTELHEAQERVREWGLRIQDLERDAQRNRAALKSAEVSARSLLEQQRDLVRLELAEKELPGLRAQLTDVLDAARVRETQLAALEGQIEGIRVRDKTIAVQTSALQRVLADIGARAQAIDYRLAAEEEDALNVEAILYLEGECSGYDMARRALDAELEQKVGVLKTARDGQRLRKEQSDKAFAHVRGDLGPAEIELWVGVAHEAELFRLAGALAHERKLGEAARDARVVKATQAHAFSKSRSYPGASLEPAAATVEQARERGAVATADAHRLALQAEECQRGIKAARASLESLKHALKLLDGPRKRHLAEPVPLRDGLPIAVPAPLLAVGVGIGELVDERDTEYRRAEKALNTQVAVTTEAWTDFLKQLMAPAVVDILSKALVEDLKSNKWEAAAEHADALAERFFQHRMAFEAEIEGVAPDFNSTAVELDSFVGAALDIVKSILSKKVPQSVPDYGDKPILKIGSEWISIAPDVRLERVQVYLKRLIETQALPASGGKLAAEALFGVLGVEKLNIKVLKVSQYRTIDYMRIDAIPSSGGELVVAATLLWSVMAKAKREYLPRKVYGPLGVLSVDNFFGKLNNEAMLRLLQQFTRELKIQCIHTILALDPNITSVYRKVTQLKAGFRRGGAHARNYTTQADFQGIKDPASLKAEPPSALPAAAA